MPLKSILKKNKQNRIIFGFSLLILILLIPLMLDGIAPFNNKHSPLFAISADGDNFDILDFWENEIERVNSTPLNIVYGENHTIEHVVEFSNNKYVLNAQDVYFNSPNWVGAQPQSLTLYGVLLYPEIIKSSNPGVLCMHGLNGEIEEAFDLAIPYLEKGFVVLCYSHPGHGKSEGAEPEPSNLYYEGAYNESAHFYLTLCGAIQGLRVLEALPFVNNSQIMVTGKSYGGLNAMWLAGILGDRVAGVTAYIAIGDIAKNLNYPDKLIFWILGKNHMEIPDSYETDQLLRFDPIYYLKSPKFPPILWQIGTNDDFFHYSSIKGTYDAVQHAVKFLQIFPNDHHGFPGFEGSSKFFIDFILNNGSIPPQINITSISKIKDLRGDNLQFAIKINSTEEIDSVQMVYKYTEILGSTWESINLDRINEMNWEGELNPTILSSNLDYYFIVNLKNMSNTWFSSNIFSAGIMISNLTIPFIIIISIIIIVPLAISIRRKYLKILGMNSEERLMIKHKITSDIMLIIIFEVIYYISLVMPWIAYQSGGVVFNHIYIFNNLYTWKLNIGEFAPYLTSIFFIATIFNSQLSFINLRLSAVMKIVYPTILLVFISVIPFLSGVLDPNNLLSNFGLVFPGIGPILMIVCSILMFLIGQRERKYKIKNRMIQKKPNLRIRFNNRIKGIEKKIKHLLKI
ncbi:MAG: alpha/beta fold hydrolase [Candidatus Lokiarchaeota archaeon]|nr:alpha/beta fold hydrolase [Candidatus Lokiarchaeota archaeon]